MKTTQTTGGGLLSAAAILSAADLPHEDVAVPEWGGTVRIRTMMSRERDEFETWLIANQGKHQNVRGHLVALCAVGDDGQRLFTIEQASALGEKSAKAMDRLFDVAQRLNGMGAADIKELEKN
ncbi:hypothetical protein P24_17147 [Oceanibaculum indicum P24]|uniref:Uncharacterized protein n=1 Tax=Oceanibaculum indicum P24 TaxID=1207063 RepID=K2JDT0_9PROT|nr:hypothetical protein P24_17147 [Oceanibaculum indicum P24]